MEHPAVAEAGVIGKPDPVAGEIVKAFVALQAAATSPTTTLRRELLGFARRRLGAAVAPQGDRRSPTHLPQDPQRQDHAPAAEGARARPARGRPVDAGERAVTEQRRGARSTGADRAHASCCAQMLRIRRFEETCVELYSAAQDPRLPAPLHRRGGGRGRRRCDALEPRRRRRRDLPRARPRAGPRRADGRGDGRDVRQARGLQPRPRRLDAPVRRRPPLLRRQRDRRRRAAARRRPGAGRHDAAAATRVTACFFGDGAVAEGEFHEPEPRRAVAAAGAVLLREQPLRDGHGAGARRVRRPTSRCKAAALRHAGLGGRRHGRRSRSSDARPAGRGARPRRRRPALPRAAHLPLPRPLDVRPGAVPRQGRGRAVAQARPDRRCSPRGCATTGCSTDDGLDGDRGRGRRRDRRRRSRSPRPARSEPVEDLDALRATTRAAAP